MVTQTMTYYIDNEHIYKMLLNTYCAINQWFSTSGPGTTSGP